MCIRDRHMVDENFVMNVAPILDAVLVDGFKDGHKQLVCCCGEGRDGALRRGVMGMEMCVMLQAQIDGLAQPQLLSLRSGDDKGCTLLLSYRGENKTQALGVSAAGEIETPNLPGLKTDSATVAAFCLSGDPSSFIQVASTVVVTVDKGRATSEWEVPEPVVLASCSLPVVAVAACSTVWFLAHHPAHKLKMVSELKVQHQASISGLELILTNGVTGHVAVGTWSKANTGPQVSLYSFSNECRLLAQFALPAAAPAKSFSFVHHGGGLELLAGLAEGTVLQLSWKKNDRAFDQVDRVCLLYTSPSPRDS
eukprot:TRINITY_DN56108_c0_g1_i1.p1 TRINITY_DN56108_c0_g1~~TRINITY_DN56108_c0_g1_i1.p1  ORF type:complete len:309 (+),score=78.81 TRINITY_DN56108_c0_g1_i1:99-1025(+)